MQISVSLSFLFQQFEHNLQLDWTFMSKIESNKLTEYPTTFFRVQYFMIF